MRVVETGACYNLDAGSNAYNHCLRSLPGSALTIIFSGARCVDSHHFKAVGKPGEPDREAAELLGYQLVWRDLINASCRAGQCSQVRCAGDDR
jgi:hypothetical protein